MMFFIFACARLPEGWEQARPVDSLTQSECAGSVEEPQFAMEAAVVDGHTEVSASEVLFRCSQEVEAFWQPTEGGAEVLVQPVDMRPRSVAKCDCAYNLEITFPEVEGEVSLWRRWDERNDPNDPVELGSAQL